MRSPRVPLSPAQRIATKRERQQDAPHVRDRKLAATDGSFIDVEVGDARANAPGEPAEERAEGLRLRGSVRMLRLAVGILVVALGVVLFAGRGGDEGERGSTVVNVAERAQRIARERGLDANQAVFFVESPSLSVHLHLMGRRHHCPLHIHPRGQEATVIVEGEARVQHVFRREGALENATSVHGEGALVASPPGCAHAFTNTSSEKILANLVFSSPGFDHNTYLESDGDERISASAPTTYSFAEEIRAFWSTTDEVRRVPLGALGSGVLTLLLTRGKAKVEPRRSGVTVIYVLEGSGSTAADRLLALGQKDLAIVRSRSTFAVEARTSSVLAVLVHAAD